MRWDRFFEDLEHQLDSEWEAERAALDTEAERLRLARLELRARLQVFAADGVEVVVDVGTDRAIRGAVTGVGADWLTLERGPRSGPALVPAAAVVSLAAEHADLLRSARPGTPGSLSSQRMSLGFVLRDLVRRRCTVTVHDRSGRPLAGTVDRAGADHLDLALHDPGEPRRASAVTGMRVIPFGAIAWVGIHDDGI